MMHGNMSLKKKCVFHPRSKLSSGNHADKIQLSRDKRAPQIGFIIIQKCYYGTDAIFFLKSKFLCILDFGSFSVTSLDTQREDGRLGFHSYSDI